MGHFFTVILNEVKHLYNQDSPSVFMMTVCVSIYIPGINKDKEAPAPLSCTPMRNRTATVRTGI